jgi:hypothetical protein
VLLPRGVYRLRVLASLVVLPIGTTAGCGCDLDLEYRVEPTSITLNRGEVFLPHARVFGCGGTDELTDHWTWSTTDPLIVLVDPESGRTTALASGSAVISGFANTYHVEVHVSVTVH